MPPLAALRPSMPMGLAQRRDLVRPPADGERASPAHPGIGARRAWAALPGLACGLMLALGLWWPAAWLPAFSWTSPQGVPWRLQGDSGTWWRGSARLVRAEGPAAATVAGSPVLNWRLDPGWDGLRPVLRLRLWPRHGAAAVIAATPHEPGVQVRITPHGGGLHWRVSDGHSLWPAAWLEPLGLPVHALDLQGSVWVRTSGLNGGEGRTPAGLLTADIVIRPVRAEVPLGLSHYELSWRGDGDAGQLRLRTLLGDLQLSGQGGPTAQGWRFRGSAQAQGAAAALRPLFETPAGPGQAALFSWIPAS